jgi:acetyltransferase-like isoleucine patch superfamily enzyme
MSAERMPAGELYDARDPELLGSCARARELLGRFNAEPDDVPADAIVAGNPARAVRDLEVT